MKKFKNKWLEIKQKRQFKKDMIDWVRICRNAKKNELGKGISRVGELTHKIEIEGIGEITTKDPIFLYTK